MLHTKKKYIEWDDKVGYNQKVERILPASLKKKKKKKKNNQTTKLLIGTVVHTYLLHYGMGVEES